VTSKARQVVEIIIAPHDTPPWLDALGSRGDMTALPGDVQPDSRTSYRILCNNPAGP
jgi:hypothetical protein